MPVTAKACKGPCRSNSNPGVRPSFTLTAICASASFLVGADQEIGADKSQFHLFNPTPRHLMREMTTDRPDRTESPFTVDAGHFQLEMDLLSYSYDRSNPQRVDRRVESVAIAPMNLKIGLLNNADLQVIVDTYESMRTHDHATQRVEETRGFGDVETRFKLNLRGNDGGSIAFAAMPFLKLPTSQKDLGNHSVEGGIIFPFTADLGGGWTVGSMAEIDVRRDERGRGHHGEITTSVTLGHDIVGRLAGYIEFFDVINLEPGVAWIGTVDVGLTYQLNNDVQLDAGINLGVTRAAEDLRPFVGLSFRF